MRYFSNELKKEMRIGMGKKKDKKKNKKKKENIDMSIKKKVYAILTILLIVLVGAYYYAFFPAVNIHLESFWGAAIVILVALGCIFALSQLKGAWSSYWLTTSESEPIFLFPNILALAVSISAISVIWSVSSISFAKS